jgi:hypothetical protein
MNTDCTLKRIMAGALLSGVAVAGLGLAAGTAQALPGPAPRYMWCPGDPNPPRPQPSIGDLCRGAPICLPGL